MSHQNKDRQKLLSPKDFNVLVTDVINRETNSKLHRANETIQKYINIINNRLKYYILNEVDEYILVDINRSDANYAEPIVGDYKLWGYLKLMLQQLGWKVEVKGHNTEDGDITLVIENPYYETLTDINAGQLNINKLNQYVESTHKTYGINNDQ